MTDEKPGESNFKVVDRRSFSMDGTRVQAETEKEEARPPRPSAPPAPAQQFEPEPQDILGPDAADFETLVSYLSTTAMFQLGGLPGPSGEPIPADLPNARRTIDLLDVLQKKTRGNLKPDEEQLLTATLYELRLGFVEVEKRLAKKAR